MSTTPVPAPVPVLDYSLQPECKYVAGTLRYTTAGLIITCGWMMWGSVCFGLMQKVFPVIMPLQLKQIGAPNQAMAILRNSIPSLLAFVLVPIISFKSDRYRSRWGRRRPFIIATAPFLVLFLVSLAYVQDIFNFMKAHSAAVSHIHAGPWHLWHWQLGGQMTPLTASLIVIGFLVVGFMFFDDFVNSVGWYLIADVIPVNAIGRFNAVSSLVGTAAGYFWNVAIFPHALTHTKWVYGGIGLLYLFGYGLMCVMVKEGDYPPVDPHEKRASRPALLLAFFRECFTHPLYISLFAFNALWAVTNACSTWSIFFSTETLHLSLGQIGQIGGYATIIGFIIAIPCGWLLDWITPVRTLVIATVLIIPATFASYFVYGYRGALIVGLVGVPINVLWDMTTGPMMMQLLPRSKYGQFSAANSMVRNLINIFIANIGAVYLDLVHNNYRYIFFWQCGWMVISLLVLLFMYYMFRMNGGPHHYMAPDVTIDGAVVPSAPEGTEPAT